MTQKTSSVDKFAVEYWTKLLGSEWAKQLTRDFPVKVKASFTPTKKTASDESFRILVASKNTDGSLVAEGLYTATLSSAQGDEKVAKLFVATISPEGDIVSLESVSTPVA